MLDISQEVQGVRLGDKRLNKRLEKIVAGLGSRPNESIPSATSNRAEMEAVYRFLDNDKVTPEGVLSVHFANTEERCSQHAVAILVQDTTELNLTRPEQQVDGMGPLEHNSRLGMFHHPLVAFDEAGVCLGAVWQSNWIREKIETERTAAQKQKSCRSRPIEEKESYRWLEGLRAARAVAGRNPHTTFILAADSEADIFEVLSEQRQSVQGRSLEIVIRSAHDRRLNASAEHLYSSVAATPLLETGELGVGKRRKQIKVEKRNRRENRDKRLATVEIRAATVTLKPPAHLENRFEPVNVNAVLINEPQPPEGQAPIQWLLLTSLPIDTIEQVKLVIHYYSIRWQIEIYFRTLKSGCRVEERYFERRQRFENCLAVYNIIAWKIMYLSALGRNCPELNCEVIFTPSEWQAVYVMIHRTVPPKEPPTLNSMTRMIASLGGYVIRKSTHPGVQTMWIGMQRTYDLANAWDIFGPNSELKKYFS